MLSKLETASDDRRVIVGPGDDAGVFELPDGSMLVETVDVITPVLDDPYAYGAISAANSLSDVYAMGAVPMTAMALFGFSRCDFGPDVTAGILRGAMDTIAHAGARLMGGHTFDDRELKFGLSVSGRIEKGAPVLRATGARAGDLLILTKPLGVGVLTTALKAGRIAEGDIVVVIRSMMELNDRSSQAAVAAGASAATDVTGFGLLGHAHIMQRGGGDLNFVIDRARVPVFQGVGDFVLNGFVPEGAYANQRHVGKAVEVVNVTEADLLPLYDPQTSGGLLLALPEDRLITFRSKLGKRPFWVIGQVERGDGRLVVR